MVVAIPMGDFDLCCLPQPYTFVPVRGFQELWYAPERERQGVYLWTVEYENGFLINYVGKTAGKKPGSRNFGLRLCEEFCYWKLGHDKPVDIEAFKRRRRVQLKRRPVGHTEREIAELAPMYRIWLIPLEQDTDCCQVEDTLVDTLRRSQNRDAFQFLGNGDKKTKYHPRPFPVVRPTVFPPLIGWSTPVPASLFGAADEVECKCQRP